jgi:hypothetical protein
MNFKRNSVFSVSSCEKGTSDFPSTPDRPSLMKTGMKTRDSELRSQPFKWIEDLQAGSAKVFVVAGDDGEVVPAGGSRDVAVFNRHAPARPLQLPLLFGPNVRDRTVEAENPSVQRSHKTSQPSLQRLPLLSLFAAHPVGKMREDDRAGVAIVLFSLDPSCHARVAVALRGLAQDIGIQQPAHNLDRKYSRRRGGRSSMGTGQALSTFSQFGFDAMRRHIKASSSASKSTRKWSPGLAGTAAGTVSRRFESRVTIMVGYSHYRPTVSTWAGGRERFWQRRQGLNGQIRSTKFEKLRCLNRSKRSLRRVGAWKNGILDGLENWENQSVIPFIHHSNTPSAIGCLHCLL